MFIDSKRKRRRRRRITTVGICLLVLGMAMYGYNVSRNDVRQQAESGSTQSAVQTPSLQYVTPNVPVVKPNDPVIEMHTEVVLSSYYLGCGHESEHTISTDGLVGLTREQLSALYPQYDITSFSSERVEMRREVEGVCPQHYMVKLEGSVLVIYQRNTDDSWRKVQTIEDFHMPYEDEALKEGVVFDDLNQIESFLENFDS